MPFLTGFSSTRVQPFREGILIYINMKKTILSIAIIGLSLIPAVSSAHIACEAGDLFNIDTGQPCGSVTLTSCMPGDLYDINTGKLCSSETEGQTTSPVTTVTFPTFSQTISGETDGGSDAPQNNTPLSSLKTMVDASNPSSRIYTINPNTVYGGVYANNVLSFNLQTYPSTVSLNTINGTLSTNGTTPTTIYLFDGSTLLESQPFNGNSFSFTGVNDSIIPNQTRVFSIRVDMPTNTINGSTVSATITGASYTDGNTGVIEATSTNVVGNPQTFNQ